MIPNSKPRRAGQDRWLVSYADFITLLFAFFVVLYAVSQSDRATAKQLSESVKRAMAHDSSPRPVPRQAAAVAAAAPARAVDLAPYFQNLSTQLRDEVAAGKMNVTLEARGIVISLREKAFFPSAEDAVIPAAYPSLAKVADIVKDMPNSIRLEGHTDSVPIHNDRFGNNWQLSAARSIAVLTFFEARYNMPARRFAIAGYADNLPVAGNDSDDGRARNRRVDIVILNQASSETP